MTKVLIPDNSSQDVSAMTDFSKMEDAFVYSHGLTEDEAAEKLLHYGTQQQALIYRHIYIHTANIPNDDTNIFISANLKHS